MDLPLRSVDDEFWAAETAVVSKRDEKGRLPIRRDRTMAESRLKVDGRFGDGLS